MQIHSKYIILKEDMFERKEFISEEGYKEMVQAGQYNFLRCLKHGETEAAQLACVEFVKSAIKTFFLLNNRYAPYYKWSFRALRSLEGCKDLTFTDTSVKIMSALNDESRAQIEKLAGELTE